MAASSRGMRLAQCNCLKDAVPLCIEVVVAAAGEADCAAVYLGDEQERAFILQSWEGVSDSFAAAASRWTFASAQGRKVCGGKTAYSQGRGFPGGTRSAAKAEGLRAWGVVPLLSGGKVIGCIGIASHDREDFGKAARERTEAVVASLAPVIRRILDYELATRSNEEIMQLADSVRDGLFIVDREGTVLWTNAYAATSLGYPREALAGRNVLDLYPVERREEARDMLRQMHDGRQSVSTIPLVRQDGSHLQKETVVTRGQWRGQDVVFGICRDMARMHADVATILGQKEELEWLVEERTTHLARRLDLEHFVALNARRFLDPGDFDSVIQNALADLGEKLTADRTYVFQFDGGLDSMSNTHEWCRPGIPPFKEELQGLPQEAFPWWMAELRAGRPIVIADVGQLPAEAEQERRILEMQGIKSLIVVGIQSGSELLGFLGMDNCMCAGPLHEADVALIALFAGILGDALHKRTSEAQLAAERERFHAILSDTDVLMCRFRADGTMTYVNGAYCRFFGVQPSQILGTDLFAFIPAEHCPIIRRHLALLTRDAPSSSHEHQVCRADGELRWQRWTDRALFAADGTLFEYQSVCIDITDRRQAEAALRDSEERYRALVECGPDAILVNRDDRFVLANAAALRLFGATAPEQLLGKTPYDLFHSDSHDVVRERTRRIREEGLAAVRDEERIVRLDGTPVDVAVSAAPFEDRDGRAIHVVLRDITDRKRAEAEREALREQFLQAQKLESVGRLAGGVAHDFNNKLMAILSYAQLCQLDLEPGHPLREYVDEIVACAKCSGDLTRQLLAFARKQTIEPEEVDLNSAVSGMLRMLQRLIGEDIHLVWRPGIGLWPTLMDPSQLDQILANLVVNGRDAIAGVGAITVETTNEVLDRAYCADHLDATPGDHVVLTVSDDGCGMDGTVKAHIFEPFFTTKEAGKGTGLGLATVYGIVKQNRGFVTVYSEPGQGTVFKIHLPRLVGGSGAIQKAQAEQPLPRGTETVLLVEDESALLRSAGLLLAELGYTVLAAASPTEALELAAGSPGQIHVLLTDVVMPEMNGRELQARIALMRPKVRCVYMSGYTADIIAHHGVLGGGASFLQKPFSLEQLARKLRKALDGPQASS